MTTAYAVYDPEGGEVVHLHVEPSGLRSSEEDILRMADPGGGRRLRVIALPSGDLPAGPVRVVDGKLRPADEGAGHGSAGSASGFPPPADPRERRYERLRPGRDPGGAG